MYLDYDAFLAGDYLGDDFGCLDLASFDDGSAKARKSAKSCGCCDDGGHGAYCFGAADTGVFNFSYTCRYHFNLDS
ncbi:hypothetical protein D3C87_1200450 [compost metagenome]